VAATEEDLAELGRALAEQLRKELAKIRSRVGTVTALGPGNKVTVTVDGATGIQLNRLSSYTPAVNDNVLIDATIQTWVVVGKILPQ
jgi:hypothetical protein